MSNVDMESESRATQNVLYEVLQDVRLEKGLVQAVAARGSLYRDCEQETMCLDGSLKRQICTLSA